MDNENLRKLEICKSCKYYKSTDDNAVFEGFPNDMYCTKLDALIRAHLLMGCPEDKW
jgi:hypothetical protein